MQLCKKMPTGNNNASSKYLQDNLATSFTERYFMTEVSKDSQDYHRRWYNSGAFKALLISKGDYYLRIWEVATSFSEADSLKEHK